MFCVCERKLTKDLRKINTLRVISNLFFIKVLTVWCKSKMTNYIKVHLLSKSCNTNSLQRWHSYFNFVPILRNTTGSLLLAIPRLFVRPLQSTGCSLLSQNDPLLWSSFLERKRNRKMKEYIHRCIWILKKNCNALCTCFCKFRFVTCIDEFLASKQCYIHEMFNVKMIVLGIVTYWLMSGYVL